MNYDKELLDLCQQVYEVTGWEDESLSWFVQGLGDKEPWILHKKNKLDGYKNIAPHYNSDYLLVRLPKDIITDSSHTYLCLNRSMIDLWAAYYGDAAGNKDTEVCRSDTPLKALLLLTLELHKANLLEVKS